jgi:hypothetical protein
MVKNPSPRTIMKNFSLEIPEDVIAHLRLPPRNLERELKREPFIYMLRDCCPRQARAAWQE